MRVIVTGSRDWPDARLIREQLAEMLARTDGTLTVVHGACPTGADRIAAEWVAGFHSVSVGPGWVVTEEPHAADWDQYGAKAGPIRNSRMVAAGADVCLAFIKGRSKGATHCARRALDAGMELHVWRQA